MERYNIYDLGFTIWDLEEIIKSYVFINGKGVAWRQKAGIGWVFNPKGLEGLIGDFGF